jgi:hypothetical protein
VLLSRQPAVDQSLPERSERFISIFIRSKPPGPLIIPGHVAQDIARPLSPDEFGRLAESHQTAKTSSYQLRSTL